MKIKMLKTFTTGIVLNEGDEHEAKETLAEYLIRKGYAEMVEKEVSV